jgi:hypothetical protein
MPEEKLQLVRAHADAHEDDIADSYARHIDSIF